MSEFPMIMVKLEIDRMKHVMKTYLATHSVEMQEIIEKEIDRAIETFDFEVAITQAAHDAIVESIQKFFTHGTGHFMIYKMINNIFTEKMSTLDLGGPPNE